ncbi:MAG: hypothetical protein GX748_16290, partial [Lentisphaerae bacterium]|nr:hypothetical protein [Lentisphaerota bacterium]
LYADAGYTVAPTELTWADSNSLDKAFTLTGPAVTPEYDPPRDMTVSLSAPAGGAVLGLAEQTVTVLDQLVSETFEEYTAGRPLYEHLAQEDDDGFWFFYNEDIDALRTEPLNGGAQAVLIWTAPAAGRLSFTWGHNSTTINTPYTNIPFTGTCLFEAGGQSLELTAAETNNTVGVNAGDVIRWTATGQVSNYVAHLKGLAWEGLTPPASAGVAPALESVIQIDHVRADTNLVNLAWPAGAGNPADITQRLYAGPAANALAEVAPAGGVASGLNAVGEGIVTLAAAQGWVYWRVDTEVSGDIGTGSVAGPVWRFAIVELPVFQPGAPASGQTWTAYLKAGSSLPLTAQSSTPVTYTAFGLPDGMAIDPQTGEISGTPKRGGTYSVTVRATNHAGSTDLNFTVEVQKLPDFASRVKIPGFLLERTTAPATGQIYEGVIAGTVNFQSRSSGKLSARLDTGGRRQSLTGTWVVEGLDASRLTATLANRKGDTMELELTADGILRGNYNGALLLGRAFDTGATSVYQGYYTAALPARVLSTASAAIDNRPEGYGYLALTVRTKGRVKYAGQLADGQRLNGSSELMVFTAAEMRAMGYDVAGNGSFALFPLYKALYGRRGHAAAMVWIEALNPAVVDDNLVWIENTQWSYPGKSARMMEDGFLAA